MKYCKDCIYFSEVPPRNMAECKHEKALTLTGPSDMIWGSVVYYSCMAMRTHIFCGVEAKLFTPKPQKFDKLKSIFISLSNMFSWLR